MNKIGEIIYKKRTELGLTQVQLARELNVSFQSVSKWENNAAYPDIEKLPELAAVLKTSVDALLGYRGVAADYDSRYAAEGYYWGLKPNRMCYEIMKLLPPIKPYRVLTLAAVREKTPYFWQNAATSLQRLTFRKQELKNQNALPSTTASMSTFLNQTLWTFSLTEIMISSSQAGYCISFAGNIVRRCAKI